MNKEEKIKAELMMQREMKFRLLRFIQKNIDQDDVFPADLRKTDTLAIESNNLQKVT